MPSKKSKSKSKKKSEKKNPKGPPKAKDLVRRVKSKGMKKLKWYEACFRISSYFPFRYCQMCDKQCSDQNGFKRHCESEGHQRQLLLFAENQTAYLREFSNDFETNFMRVRFWTLSPFSPHYNTSLVSYSCFINF